MPSKRRATRKSPSRTASPGDGPRPAHPDLLERGDIFFFYRPSPRAGTPSGLVDVNRFHVVLRPEGGERLRYLTVGKKRLPGDEPNPRNWGFVAGAFQDPEALRAVLMAEGGGDDGDTNPDASRAAAVPAGEGVYALVRRGRNTVLAYALELPEQPGEVQRELNIEPRGHLTLTIKNPEVASPEGLGLDEERKVDFPAELQERFGSRKWIGADPPAFLDHEGAEFLLIAGDDDMGDPDIDLAPESEDASSADVFEELHLEPSEEAKKPLFEGAWS